MLFERKEKGQGMVEYALIVLLIAIALLLVTSLLGSQLSNTFSYISSMIEVASD
jgi:pilus assembly protein Flp/PilA